MGIEGACGRIHCTLGNCAHSILATGSHPWPEACSDTTSHSAYTNISHSVFTIVSRTKGRRYRVYCFRFSERNHLRQLFHLYCGSQGLLTRVTESLHSSAKPTETTYVEEDDGRLVRLLRHDLEVLQRGRHDFFGCERSSRRLRGIRGVRGGRERRRGRDPVPQQENKRYSDRSLQQETTNGGVCAGGVLRWKAKDRCERPGGRHLGSASISATTDPSPKASTRPQGRCRPRS